jgi:hypothetical protein
MAVSFVAAGVATSNSTAIGTDGLSIAVPTGYAADDLLLLVSHRNDNNGVFDVPSGWTRLDALTVTEDSDADMQSFVAWKKSTASESAVTITHTDTTAEQWLGIMLAYRGVDTTTPIDVTPTASHESYIVNCTNPYSDVMPPITTSTDGAMVVTIMCSTSGSSDFGTDVPPTGYATRLYQLDNQRSLAIWDKIKATAGLESPGAPAFTVADLTRDQIHLTLALKEQGAAPSGGSLLLMLQQLGI